MHVTPQMINQGIRVLDRGNLDPRQLVEDIFTVMLAARPLSRNEMRGPARSLSDGSIVTPRGRIIA